MTKQGPVTVLLSLCIVGTACGRFDGGRNAPAPSNGAATAARMSKSDMENAVQAKFKVDERLRSADLDVSADLATNEITLSGTVESQELRDKAVELTRGAHSGVTVNDRIDVKPSTAEKITPSRKPNHA